MRKLMHSTPAARKLGLLALGILFAVLVIGTPQPARAFCHNWTDIFNYYYDAAHTEPAGECEFDCYCQTYCSGDQTPYYDHVAYSGCL
jgi:hypothetical protein